METCPDCQHFVVNHVPSGCVAVMERGEEAGERCPCKVTRRDFQRRAQEER